MNRGKDKLTAGLLGILLGGFGIHHFYLGSTTSGIIQIVLTIVTCGIGGILGLIEGILILVMSQEDFDKRYNERAPQPLEFVFMQPK
ncbi:MAG TPA: TM2 domain-containing protein [Thermoanaerobaculia bacterium]